jgi:hypothetical protein
MSRKFKTANYEETLNQPTHLAEALQYRPREVSA